MTIRVIGHDPEAARRVTCPECASRLEYVLSDETRGERSIMGRDTETVWWIACPSCKAHVVTRRES